LNSTGQPQKIAAPAPWLLLLFFAGFAALYLFLHREIPLSSWWLEDLPVYADAINAFSAGQNPYGQIHGILHFVYPPAVLYAGSFLARLLPAHTGWCLFIAAHIVSVLAMPLLLARYYLRQTWLTPAFAMLIWFAEPRFTGILALYSANIAPLLYFLCLAAALPAIRKNRWSLFYAVVLIAGVVKITFVVLLLLPILVGQRQRMEWIRSILCGLVLGCVYALEKVFTPILYAGYKGALLQQLKVQGLYGYGIFGLAATIESKLRHTVGAPSYAVHLLFAAAIFGVLLWLRQRKFTQPDNGLWMALILMAIILINPRVLHYDAYIALFAAFVALALVLETRHLLILMTCLFLPSLAVSRLVHSPSLYGFYETLVILIAFTIGAWKLTRRSIPIPTPAKLPSP
jgi:hypothetical protein